MCSSVQRELEGFQPSPAPLLEALEQQKASQNWALPRKRKAVLFTRKAFHDGPSWDVFGFSRCFFGNVYLTLPRFMMLSWRGTSSYHFRLVLPVSSELHTFELKRKVGHTHIQITHVNILKNDVFWGADILFNPFPKRATTSLSPCHRPDEWSQVRSRPQIPLPEATMLSAEKFREVPLTFETLWGNPLAPKLQAFCNPRNTLLENVEINAEYAFGSALSKLRWKHNLLENSAEGWWRIESPTRIFNPTPLLEDSSKDSPKKKDKNHLLSLNHLNTSHQTRLKQACLFVETDWNRFKPTAEQYLVLSQGAESRYLW